MRTCEDLMKIYTTRSMTLIMRNYFVKQALCFLQVSLETYKRDKRMWTNNLDPNLLIALISTQIMSKDHTNISLLERHDKRNPKVG